MPDQSSSRYSSSQQPHPQHEPDDYKTHYDDLIEQYATPYPYTAASQPHRTYNVAVTPAHRRASSNPLNKHSFASESKDIEDSSDMAHSADTAHSAYPPTIPPPTDAVPKTFWRKLLPESMACRLYLITVLIETAIDLAIEAELGIRVQHADEVVKNGDLSTRKMAVFLAIFAIAHVFQFVMAVDAVYNRNTLQFIALGVFNALLLVYAIIQIDEIKGLIPEKAVSAGISGISVTVLSIIMPAVIAASEVAYIALGWRIYHEFGWKVYKFLGADRRIKKMYANYQIFECLVKFDVFFWVGFSIQFIWLVLQDTDWEYYVTCAALPLSMVLLVEGHLAARHENKWMMLTFIAGCMGAMIYFIYKLVKVIVYKKTTFQLVYKSLTVFSVLAIVFLIITFAFSVIVMRNFGRGLKSSFARQATLKKQAGNGSHLPNGLIATANAPNRMSIQ